MAEPDRGPCQGQGEAPSLPSGRLAEDLLWEDWAAPLRVDPVPVLHLDGFDGPMDQLLDLVERGRLDIAGLSPVAIVDQLDAALARLARHSAVHRRADWVILAARLLLLRSRVLYAGEPPPAGEAVAPGYAQPTTDGRRVLSAVADWLAMRPQLGRDVFARAQPGRSPRIASYMALMEACLALLEGRAGQAKATAVYVPPTRDLWTAALATRHIRAKLAERPDGGDLLSFVPVIADTPERAFAIRGAVAATLIASLELARDGEVGLDQPRPAAPISLSLRTQAEASSASEGIAPA